MGSFFERSERALSCARIGLGICIVVLLTPGAHADDCNRNGVDDLEDVQPALAFEPLDRQIALLWDSNAVGTGDLDGDGDLDLVAAGRVNPGLVWIANENGELPWQERITSGVFIDDLKVADADGDRDLDLIVLETDTSPNLVVYQNDGRARFSPAPGLRLAGFQIKLDLLDLNSDSLVDAAAAAGDRAKLWILLQKTGGGWEIRETIEPSSPISSLVARDLDADGRTDLAGVAGPGIAVYSHEANGSFALTLERKGDLVPVLITALDADGDGDGDLMTANNLPVNELPDNISYFENTGGRKFGVPRHFAVGRIPRDIDVGDFDGAGGVDVAVLCQGTRTLELLAGDGKGRFSPWESIPVEPSPWAVSPGDFDGNGGVDFALAHRRQSTALISILKRSAAGTFQTTKLLSSYSMHSVWASDLDGDLAPDLVLSQAPGEWEGPYGPMRLQTLRGDGRGGFQQANSVSDGFFNGWRARAALSDLDGDGDVDIAVPEGPGGELEVFRNDGTGAFQPGSRLSMAKKAYAIEIADFESDGTLDIVAARNGVEPILLFHGLGRGKFAETPVAWRLALEYTECASFAMPT